MALEARDLEEGQTSIDRLHDELTVLRASRKQLVLAADADRRALERSLHEGAQQDLVALAVDLQLATRLMEQDAAALKRLLEKMGRDVQEALDRSAELAARIYPPLLESGGLAVAVRTAAVQAGITVHVEGAAATGNERQAAALTCLQALEHAAPGARATVAADDESSLRFEIVGEGDWRERFEPLRRRAEALGGELRIEFDEGESRVWGSVPWEE